MENKKKKWEVGDRFDDEGWGMGIVIKVTPCPMKGTIECRNILRDIGECSELVLWVLKDNFSPVQARCGLLCRKVKETKEDNNDRGSEG